MSEPDSTFSLRALIREVGRTSLVADPGLLADDVYRRIPAEDRDAALQQALRQSVRQVMSEERMQTQITAPSSPGTSAKVQGIRDHWQRALRDRLNVGEGVWKFLADCTAEDLIFAAEQRREQASRNRAKAAQFDTLRQQLDEHGVDRVGDLPANVLVTSLGRVA